MRIAIVYDTGEGHTAKIAQHLAEQVQRDGHEPLVRSVRHLPRTFDLDEAGGVIVGGSIHAGRHSRHLVRFVRAHRTALDRLPAGFFSVSLSAAGKTERQQANARRCLERFLHQTGWSPAHTATFAGALRYRDYGPLKRRLMRWIVSREGGDTDTSRNYDYTDPVRVAAFAHEVALAVEAAHGSRPS